MSNRQGFTLVELSIVLVIIGLLVGGVMVGRDLMTAGSVKKQVAQIDQYKTATNTFRDKYQGLPGDLIAGTANRFGMANRSGAAGHGDGNGRIEGCAASAKNAGCETLTYWTDLSFAGFITPAMTSGTDMPTQMASLNVVKPSLQQQFADFSSHFTLIADAHAVIGPPITGDPSCMMSCVCADENGTYSVNDTSPSCNCDGMCSPAPATSLKKDDFVPRASVGSNSVTVYTDGSQNYFQLTHIVSTDASGVYTLRDGLNPLDAFSIDSKLDDGKPLTGSVRAMGGTGPLGVPAVPSATGCVNTITDNPYNTTEAYAEQPLCQLSLRMN